MKGTSLSIPLLKPSQKSYADRDIYQARLARRKMLTGEGTFESNETDLEKLSQTSVLIVSSSTEFLQKWNPRASLSPFESLIPLYTWMDYCKWSTPWTRPNKLAFSFLKALTVWMKKFLNYQTYIRWSRRKPFGIIQKIKDSPWPPRSELNNLYRSDRLKVKMQTEYLSSTIGTTKKIIHRWRGISKKTKEIRVKIIQRNQLD